MLLASLILHCLHKRSKSFWFSALWRHKIQCRHIRCRLLRISKGCTFLWCI